MVMVIHLLQLESSWYHQGYKLLIPLWESFLRSIMLYVKYVLLLIKDYTWTLDIVAKGEEDDEFAIGE